MRRAGLLMLLLVACDPGTAREFGELSVQYRVDDVIVTGREGTIRLGDVVAGARVSTQVVLINRGLDPVRVTSIEAVSGATSQFQPELILPVVIQPGAELPVPVVFAAGLIEEEVKATFRFNTGNPNGAATVHFEARTVKVECELPETVDFGVQILGETSTSSLELKNPSDQPLTVSLSQLVPGVGPEGQFEAPPGSPLGDEFEIPARDSRVVKIHYRPTVVGSHTATLTVSHPACGERRVEFVGEAVESTLSFAPAGDCGAVPVGQQVTREITFTNLGNKDATLSDIQFTNRPNEFKVVADAGEDPRTLVVPAKGTGTLRIACQPASPGLKLDTLTFKTNLRQATGSINVKVFGGGPVVSLSRPMVDFGEVPFSTGSSATWTLAEEIRLTNVGSGSPNYPLNFSVSIVAASPNTLPDELTFSVLGADPSAGLADGESAVITVTLRSRSVGSKAAVIRIHSNDFVRPDLEIPVSAEIVATSDCQYSMDLAEVDFGRTSPGSRRTLWAPITNLGANDCFVRVTSVTAPHFRVADADKRIRLQPHQRHFIPVVLQVPEDVAPGALHGEFEFLISTSTDVRKTFPLRADLGESCVFVAPGDFDFGSVQTACASETRTLRVYGTCSTSANLTQVSASGTGFASCGAGGVCGEFRVGTATGGPQLSLGAPVQIPVRYAPTDQFEDLAFVKIRVEQGGQPVDYILAMRGKGASTMARTETFAKNRDADVLMVIDDSMGGPSPLLPQTILSNSYASFISQADGDWQLGVVTTDFDDPALSGRLTTSTGPILHERILRPSSADVEAQFRSKVDVGHNGSAHERGVLATIAALTPPLAFGHNEGFLRDDAALNVFAIIEGQDQSFLPIPYSLERLLSVKGINRRNDFSFSANGPFDPTPSCSYDVGPDTGEYRALIEGSGGILQEICEYPLTQADVEAIGAAAMGLRTRYFLGAVPASSSAITVTTSLGPLPETVSGIRAWSYDPAINAIDFYDGYVPAPGSAFTVGYAPACHAP